MGTESSETSASKVRVGQEYVILSKMISCDSETLTRNINHSFDLHSCRRCIQKLLRNSTLSIGMNFFCYSLMKFIFLRPPNKKPHVNLDDTTAASGRNSSVQASLAQQAHDVLQVRRPSSRPTAGGSGSGRSSTVVSSASAMLQPLQTARRSTGNTGSAPRRMFAMTPSAAHPATSRLRPNPLMPTSSSPAATIPPHRVGLSESAVHRRATTAAMVPEELVNQFETVLQGEWRRAVVRELRVVS
jgi:hypothetical protein